MLGPLGGVCGLDDCGSRTLKVGGLVTLYVRTINIRSAKCHKTIVSSLPDSVVLCLMSLVPLFVPKRPTLEGFVRF